MTMTHDEALSAVLEAAGNWLSELSQYIIPASQAADDGADYSEAYAKLEAALALLGGTPQADQGLNIDPAYWTDKMPHALENLAELVGRSVAMVAEELALIAGDRAHVPDAEVLSTFRGDNDLPETPEEFTDKQSKLALLMFNMSHGPVASIQELQDYDIDLYDNYMEDGEAVLRSQPHLLGLGTREEVGLWD